MASNVTVVELQEDFKVKHFEAHLTFPRVSKSRLCIVTNQKTQFHLLNDAAVGSLRPEGGDHHHEKSPFQHGVSTKVFSVTDPTGTAWEVRLLLSPSEISRLSSNYNLTGFVSSCLTTEKYRKSLSSLCGKRKADVQELSMAAAQFLSCSEDDQVSDYCKNLNLTLNEKLEVSCTGEQKMKDMVVGALVALVAAELATSVTGTRSYDYKADKEKTREDQTEQILKLIKDFDVMAELLTVTHQGKKVQIIFRNPCPDNWASGGKKLVYSGETFVFGLCHKVVSISEAESEIQFLQNLQESYDLVSVFHLPAFVEHLLMTSSWRNKIELFLKEKDQREEIIIEMSSLAVRFICSKTWHQKAFLKEFQSEMLKKLSSVEECLVGDEVVCAFGILVAILAAVAAKSIVDRPIPNDDEEEVIIKKVKEDGEAPGLFDSPEDWVRGKSGDVDKGGADSKIGSINDPETTDQASINDSPKTAEPLAGPLGVSTLDIANQEIGNDNANENCHTYPDARVIGNVESTIGSTNDQGTTGQGSINGSPETAQHLAEPSGVSTLDNANQEIGNDNTKENFHEYPGARGISSVESKIDSTSGPETTDQGSINDSPKTAEPLAEPLGVNTLDTDNQEKGNDNANENFHKYPGARGIGSVESEICSTNYQGTRGQSGISGSPKTAEPLAGPPGVGTLDIGDQDLGNNNSDENFHKYSGARNYAQERSPTIPEIEEGLHSQSSSGGPNLDNAKDIWTSSLAPPLNVGAGDNSLETQDLSSVNTIFNTRFIVLICLLVVAVMLTPLLPESLSSVFVAIILGLLVVIWLARRHP